MNTLINVSAFSTENIGRNLDIFEMEKLGFTNARNMAFQGKIAIK